MKKQLLTLLIIIALCSCNNKGSDEYVVQLDTPNANITSIEPALKVLKFGDLLDSVKKVNSKKTLQKTILDFKLGMSESSYHRAYEKLNMFEYAPNRMAYNIEFTKGEMAASCEFNPEFINGKLNRLTINISNPETSYSHDAIKALLNKRYNTEPVFYDHPGKSQDALWIANGLLTGLTRAREDAIRVDVLSFSYTKDLIDEYKFMDKKREVKKANEAF